MSGPSWLRGWLIRWLGLDRMQEQIAQMEKELAAYRGGWLIRWLGLDRMQEQIAQMEKELAVYREHLAEAVVLPPGRDVLLSWRQRPAPEQVAQQIKEVHERSAFWAR